MSIFDTRAQNAQAAYPNNFDWPLHRQQQYGYIEGFTRSNLLSQAAKDTITNDSVWNSPALELPVLNKGDATVTQTAMDCSFGTGESTSSFISVVFIQGHFDVEIFFNEHKGNKISLAEDFMKQFRGGEENMADIIEAAMFNAMDNAKSTTYNSNFIGAGKRYGALLADTIQVSDPLSDRFFYDGKSIMGADNFKRTGNNVIGDAQLGSYFDFFTAQGGGNAVNLAPQFAGYRFGASNSTVTTATAVSTGFIYAPNLLDFLSRVAPVFTGGQNTHDISFGTQMSDLLGVNLGWKRTITCADGDSRFGSTPPKNALAVREQTTYQYDVAILIAHDTSTNGGIKKFDILP